MFRILVIALGIVIFRIFCKCWEAMIRLLEFLVDLVDELTESPHLPRQLSLSSVSRSTSGQQESFNSLVGSVVLEEEDVLHDYNERSDPSLTPLLLRHSSLSSLDLQLYNSVFEDDVYYDYELSASPATTGIFLNHIVQSPISRSQPLGSLFVPPIITDLSIEILLEIFRFSAIDDDDASTKETASPLVLECIRLVCRRWKAIVDSHYFLIATPGFLVQDCGVEPPTWSRRFDERCKFGDIGPVVDTVAFHLCNRFASSMYTLNVEHARIFTEALRTCKTARIVIDLVEAELDEVLFIGSTLPPIPLHDFSWTSEHMGIRHILPKAYQFPWVTLMQDLPWQQLTRVDLNCPLSGWDAYHVLACGTKLTDARLATLKTADDSDQDGLPILHVVATSLLHSLTIHSQINLHPLFSNLRLPKLASLSLSIVHPRSSLGLVFKHSRPTFLDHSINVPWMQIEGLYIRYRSSQGCDIAPILASCGRLRRLTLDGDLNVGSVPGFVDYLDRLTLGAGDFHEEFFESLSRTTIKRLELSSTPSSVRQLRWIKAVEELSIAKAINLKTLLGCLEAVDSLCVGRFHVSRSVSKARIYRILKAQGLERLDITTSNGLIRCVESTGTT